MSKAKIRVLIVDDSAVVRQTLSDVLSADPAIEVIGTASDPFVAAERGDVDDVIEPRETRSRVIRALRMLENKVDTMPRKKHGNIPL